MGTKSYKAIFYILVIVTFFGCLGSSNRRTSDGGGNVYLPGPNSDCQPPDGAENVYVMDPNSDYYLTLRTDTPWLADADSWERNPYGYDGTETEFRQNPNQDCPADGIISGPDQEAFVDQGYPYFPTSYCCREVADK